jgi:hypothetical protein
VSRIYPSCETGHNPSLENTKLGEPRRGSGKMDEEESNNFIQRDTTKLEV